MGVYFNAVQALSPVAYWRLGETSGTTAADAGPNALHGTYTGTCGLGADSLISSESDKSLSLSNAGYVSVGAQPKLNLSAFTIVVVVRLSSLAPISHLFSNYRTPEASPFSGTILTIRSTGIIELFTSFSYSSDAANRSRSTATLATDTTYQVVASFSGGVAKLYINGVLDSTHTGKQAPEYTDTQANLGGNSNTPSFNGLLDEVCVFNRVLSDAEVAGLYAAQLQSYSISGIIRDRLGNPCQRKVYAVSRPTDTTAPQILAHGLSDPITGAYELAIPSGEEVTRVVVAEDEGTPGPDDPVLPDLVHRIIPA